MNRFSKEDLSKAASAPVVRRGPESEPHKVVPRSFAPQVRTSNSDPKFYGNALRFATREEAEANVNALMMRWFSVVETRVIETEDPVTYRWVDGKLEDWADAPDSEGGEL